MILVIHRVFEHLALFESSNSSSSLVCLLKASVNISAAFQYQHGVFLLQTLVTAEIAGNTEI